MSVLRSPAARLVGVLLLTIMAACSSPAPRSSAPSADTAPAALAPVAVAPAAPVVVRPTIDPAKAIEELQRAIALLESKDYLRAEAIFEELTRVLPQQPEAHFNLAWVKQQLGKHAEVGMHVADGLKWRPNEIPAYLVFALSERELGRFRNAESVYLAALTIAPGDDRLHLNLGILYDLYLQRPKEALEQYRHYQRLQATPSPQVGGWIVAMERAAAKPAVDAGAAVVTETPVATPEASAGAARKPAASTRKAADSKKTRKAKKS